MGLHRGEEVPVGACTHFLPQLDLDLRLGISGGWGSHPCSWAFLHHSDRHQAPLIFTVPQRLASLCCKPGICTHLPFAMASPAGPLVPQDCPPDLGH